jgi:hypothetical protein
MRYYQEVAPGVAKDRAEIISLDEAVETPAGKFDNVLKVEETNPLEGNEKEYKFHASGIGLIQDADLKLVSYVLPKVQEEEGKVINDDQKRMEKRKAIVAKGSGEQIHQRHMQASPASRGEYTPGLDYTLEASGTASGETEQDATLAMDISVWKSNSAIVIMDVVGGTITVGQQEYEIVVGYGIYSVRHNVFRSAALAVADNGEVLALRLYGVAGTGSVELATAAGEGPVELAFDGNAHRNSVDEWVLVLDGTLQP